MKTAEHISCTACENSHYEEVCIRYETTASDEVQIVIPKAKVLRCPKCGDELIPPETQEQIDRAVAEQTEQLSQLELEELAERFGLDQTQISEALGLGGKTFHRWLNGSQYPSRSMGYYLRVLAEFPDAFEWLKERGWRKRNRIAQFHTMNIPVQFRDLDWISTQAPASVRTRIRPAALHSDACRFNPASLFRQTKVS